MSQAHARDLFDLKRQPAGDRSTRRAWVVRCSGCDATDTITDTSRSAIPPEALVAKFSRRGWRIHARSRRHLCAACAWSAALTKLPSSTHHPEETTMAAEPPRKPSLEDRRRINDQIDKCWNVAAGCYAKSFSDQAIAEHLDVPRAWVSEIRELLFGADDNEARRAGSAEADALASQIDALEEMFKSEIAELRGKVEALRKAAAA